MNILNELINKSKIPYFICVGTMKSELDKVGCLVGAELEKCGFKVLGTPSNQVNGKTIPDLYETIIKNIDKEIYQVICIDASVGYNITPISVIKASVKPGAGVRKELPSFGDLTIHINLEYFVHNALSVILFEEGFYDFSIEISKMINITKQNILETFETYTDKIEYKTMSAIYFANLLLNKNFNLRQIAKLTGYSKTTVDRWINVYIEKVNPCLAELCKKKLREHFNIKHINGGYKTQEKFKLAKTDRVSSGLSI